MPAIASMPDSVIVLTGTGCLAVCTWLTSVRRIYADLIEADNELRKLNKEKLPNYKIYDYDADGADEIVITSEDFTSVFKPRSGWDSFGPGLEQT